MSWPVMWLVIIALLVAAYFVGQARLDHQTPTAVPTAATHH